VISGVILTPLKIIADDRGAVMHVLRRDSEVFRGFGEAYFSTVKPGGIKAWKRQKQMTLNVATPIGKVRFVLYDDRPGSATRGMIDEILLGPDNYQLLTVPPGIWNGFCAEADTDSLVINVTDTPYNAEDVDRLPSDTTAIPYTWPLRD